MLISKKLMVKNKENFQNFTQAVITGPNTLKGVESDQSTSRSMTWSVNEALVTELEPR